MKTGMMVLLFTNETQATLDGTDRWGKDWVGNGHERHARFRRQLSGGRVMIWAGINGDELVGLVRVPEGVKITSAAYCQLLESALLPWLEDVPLLKRCCKLIFQQDNVPSYSAKATKAYLSSIGFERDRLITFKPSGEIRRPACSPDLSPIENFWLILKQAIYHDGKQYSSKGVLWNEIKTAASNITSSEIRKLTESVEKRIEMIF